jgi:hypothetical protein
LGGGGVCLADGGRFRPLRGAPRRKATAVVCFDEMPCASLSLRYARLPLLNRDTRRATMTRSTNAAEWLTCFAFFESKGCWRHMEVTERRTGRDFAFQMRRLWWTSTLPAGRKGARGAGEPKYPYRNGALRGVCAQGGQADLSAPLGVFHYTPKKHGSWLNQVEIEFLVLSKQCLSGRRIPDLETLAQEIWTWEYERNERRATVTWRFTAEEAREKLTRLYPPQS